MSEYKRFVAYFYEYIDGKKQGNAGFAKVELRNGMWRILFRLTLPDAPEPPVQVYGFVREQGYQLEFPLGVMSEENFGPEEWAWRADAPVGFEKYYFDQMTGIRIYSGDGRIFLTVWDDEPVETDRFVAELPNQVPPEEPRMPGLEIPPLEPARIPEIPPLEPAGIPEIPPLEPTGIPEIPSLEPAGMPEISPIEMPNQDLPEEPETPVQEPSGIPEVLPPKSPEVALSKLLAQLCYGTDEKAPCTNPAEILLRGRQPFRPFGDEEFFDCVQIKLCDLLPLQQEGWQVGRSNFLQHGYYLYRHLLLGRTKSGGYVVGVPGLRSQQEEYIARTFGYDRFKLSGLHSCGRKLGYWCRVLNDSGAVVEENSIAAKPEREDQQAERTEKRGN